MQRDEKLPGDAFEDTAEQAATDWLLTLETGEPSSAEMAEFAAWCDADPRHGEAFEIVRRLWQDAEALRPEFEVQPQVGRGVLPGWVENFCDFMFGAPFRLGRCLAAGAVAACLGLISILLVDHGPRLFADHWTGVGERVTVQLPDGSVAHLNTDTAIAVAFDEKARRIELLSGEALFDVVRDEDRPFQVDAAGGRTTAVGTAFVVREDVDIVSVAVTEGMVSVRSPQPAEKRTSGTGGDPSAVMLNPGERVIYGEGRAPGAVEKVDPRLIAAWHRGALVFENEPLHEALSEIERYRKGTLVLIADSAQLEPVTATLSLATLDQGVDALAATHGLSVYRLTPFLTVIR